MDNILLRDEFNINILSNGLEPSTDLIDLWDMLSLESLVNNANSSKCVRGSSIDIMLTNKSDSFRYTVTVTIGFMTFTNWYFPAL